MLADFRDCGPAIVQRVREGYRVSGAVLYDIQQMLWLTVTATRNHRHADCRRDRPRELDVKSLACALAVYRRDEDLAGAQLHAAASPLDGIDTRAFSAAICIDLPPGGRLLLRLD